MSWIAIGVLLLVGFLLGVQLYALFKARRIKGRPVTGLTGPLGEAVNAGRRNPVEYPEQTEGSTAGAWNTVAAQNNRVEFRLAPAA